MRKLILYLCIGGIIVGLIFMAQPFCFSLFKWSFTIFGVSGLVYLISGFIPAKAPLKVTSKIIILIMAIMLAAIGLGIYIAPILVKML